MKNGRKKWGGLCSNTLYRFYPILLVGTVLIVIFARREIGPMYAAEMKVKRKGYTSIGGEERSISEDDDDLDPPPFKPKRC